jgi:hypothetical protein
MSNFFERFSLFFLNYTFILQICDGIAMRFASETASTTIWSSSPSYSVDIDEKHVATLLALAWAAGSGRPETIAVADLLVTAAYEKVFLFRL